MIQKCCAVCLPTLFQGANLETHKSFHWKSIQSCVFSLDLYLRNLAIHSFKVCDRITLPQGSRLWNWRLASFVSTNPPDIKKHQEAHTFPDANLRNTGQHRTWQTQNVIWVIYACEKMKPVAEVFLVQGAMQLGLQGSFQWGSHLLLGVAKDHCLQLLAF